MKKLPERSCIGCGEKKGKNELIRIVRSPEGEFSLDESSRKNGRGAYLCRNAECLRKAWKRRGLEKSFREAISAEVYEALREEFEKIAG
ncbi:YlxR family protein [Oribacterium sp. oral taxon 102]|uniref:RNase P modulator RnpM n=1 Tax=Oribacterium sp. oral taxon 102 TaxID=671214 RepID=UPI0015BF4197|nr:YlxR family protein [Oribacterium sp. oral taxon 102]NWO21934.1 YlxR family protein [Oribacterium sp. oral taxon 102]